MNADDCVWTSRRLERRYKRSRLADDRRLWVEHERKRHQTYRTKERAYWMARVCSEAKHPQQLWRSLNTLMGANEKNNLPRNCPSAQQFADFFEAKVAAVRKATGNSGVSTELQPATEVFDHFETCTSTEVNAVITRAASKSCEMDPIPTDVLKKFLPELLPYY